MQKNMKNRANREELKLLEDDCLTTFSIGISYTFREFRENSLYAGDRQNSTVWS